MSEKWLLVGLAYIVINALTLLEKPDEWFEILVGFILIPVVCYVGLFVLGKCI